MVSIFVCKVFYSLYLIIIKYLRKMYKKNYNTPYINVPINTIPNNRPI